MSDSTIAAPAAASDKWLYGLGSVAAALAVLQVVITGPVLVMNPIPTTVLGHITQISDNKLVGLIDLDLTFAVSEILLAFIFIALFAALRQINRVPAMFGLGAGLAASVIYLAINPTLSFLYISDQYAGATTDAQRASMLAAGDALWANYQGTAFAVAYILSAVAILVFSAVMLRSRVFNRWTAVIGLITGVVMLVPPLPALGTFGVTASYLSLLPLVVWEALVAWRLFELATGRGGEKPASVPLGRVTTAS